MANNKSEIGRLAHHLNALVLCAFRDLRLRKPIRISIPESVARLQPLTHLDWLQDVEPDAPIEVAQPQYYDRIALRMDTLDARYRGLIELTYHLGGQLLYRMLGCARYAARVIWIADTVEN